MSLQNIRAGKAVVEIAADSTHLGRDLRAAREKIGQFGNSLRSLTTSFAGVFSGAAISGGILGAAKSFADTGDVFAKMSQRSGVSAQALSELSLAAKLSDVSVESLGKGFQFMQRTLVEAARGSKKQSGAITELGLSLRKLTRLSPEQQFEEFAEAINKIQDPARRTTLAMDIFGRSGYELIPLLAEGRDGLRAFKEEARDLGLSFSEQDANSAAAFGDALEKVRLAIGAVYERVGAALAPMLTRLSDIISRVTGTVANWLNQNRGIVALVGPIVAALSSAGAAAIGVGLAFKLIAISVGPMLLALMSALGTALAAVGSFLAAIALPAAAVGAAIGGLTATLYGLGITWADVAKGIVSVWRSAMSSLGQTFAPVGNVIGRFVSRTVEAFSWMYSGATQYFGAIGKALADGNLEGAGQVAMAGLKRAFRGGFNVIYGYYLGFIEGWQNAWDAWTFGLSRSFMNAWWGIETVFNEVGTALIVGWDFFTGYLQDAWLSVVGFIQKAWIRLKALFGADIDADGEAAKIDQANREARLERRGEFDQRTAQRVEERNRRRREIDDQQTQAQSILREQQDARKRARADATSKLMNEANAEFEKAKADYESSLKSVHEFKPDFKARKETFGFDPDELSSSDLEESTKAAEQKISSKGTFSAFAIGGLADDSVSKHTLETAKNTAKLVELMERAGIRFA